MVDIVDIMKAHKCQTVYDIMMDITAVINDNGEKKMKIAPFH